MDVEPADHVSELPLVELRDVERQYPHGTKALAGVSLTVYPGEMVAIVGRSGSGKSTLLNVLGLLDVPTSGEILLDGDPVHHLSDKARSERRANDLGFVFQRAHLMGALGVAENVELGLRYGVDAGDRGEEVAIQALNDVDLGHRTKAIARTLSGGEMQRVAIARTVARPARLWLADEPTGNLDSAQSREIIHLLKERALDRGAALIVVTHEPDIAAQMDRVITLSDGRVIADKIRIPRRVAPMASDAARASMRRSVTALQRLRRTARFVMQGLAAHPGRTRAGVAASALAVALTVAALGLAQSASAQVTSMFDARRASNVTAGVFFDAPDASRWPLDMVQLTAFPGVRDAELWWSWDQTVMTNGSVVSDRAALIQVDSAPGMASASTIRWAPTDNGTLDDGEAVLGTVLAKRLGVAQIDMQPEVVIGGVRLRVVGVLEESRAPQAVASAFVLPSATQSFTPSLQATIYVQTDPGAARPVADRIKLLVDPYLTATKWAVDPVVTADAYRGQLEDGVASALLVLAVVASLAGLVAVVFVNILSVGARTAEFGVRRALGATRGELIGLVVGESAVLGIAGAICGLALGFVVVMVVTAVARWQPVFDPRLLIIPCLGALSFATLGGVPPAISAGRIHPADAVRG